MSRLQRRSWTRGRSRLATGLCAAALALAATTTTTAATAAVTTPAVAAAATSVITIAQTPTGTSLKDDSHGLSFEASALELPGFAGGNLGAYLKPLGTSG